MGYAVSGKKRGIVKVRVQKCSVREHVNIVKKVI